MQTKFQYCEVSSDEKGAYMKCQHDCGCSETQREVAPLRVVVTAIAIATIIVFVLLKWVLNV